MGEESLTLKWGTLKGWDLKNDASKQIAQQWENMGHCMSAMAHRDTPEQQKLLCDLIDAVDGEIFNDWTGETMTKDGAKAYILNYRR